MAVSKATQALIDKAVAEAVSRAVAGTVATSSKPQHVKALRATWRKSEQHLTEQAFRFGRLFLASALPVVVSLVASGTHYDRKTLLALLVPVFETAYRQVFPALGAAKADDAPGMTIVPDQVTDDVAPVEDASDLPLADLTSSSLPAVVSGDDDLPRETVN